MSNSDIVRILQETADLIELTNGNPHRARAFSRAARRLRDLDEPVKDRLRAGTLTDVDGIGEAMANHVDEIRSSGTFPLHEQLINAVPPGLLDVLQVNGLGTKRTRRLWNELHVTSLDDLENTAEADQISALDGFGAKTQQKILENVRRLRAYESQWRYAEARSALSPFLDAVEHLDLVERVEPTGPCRRRLETVDRIDLLVATPDPDALQSWCDETLSSDVHREDDTVVGSLPEGIPIRIHRTTEDRFGTDWWRTTGSSNHRKAFQDHAGSPHDHPRERDVFAAAGLAFIPPSLREGRGEIKAAATDALPALITTDDLSGCLHNHSTYSDGSDSLRDMVDAAQSMGFSYFCICDHSQSLQIANGLSPDEVRQQQAEIRQINVELDENESDFRVFSGIESDIKRDGSLDYDEAILETFDLVVASIHTGFSMTEEEATERVVQAIRNPYTDILGHPTGRLLLSREGYPLDHARVIDACAEAHTAIELNANPYRLDLDWRWIRRATDQNVLISINPDAHGTDELEYVKWGVAVARKGWLTADQCLNTKSRADFADWLENASPNT